MAKLILFMHSSLDGFCAGPNGEMDWIRVDQEIFAYGHQRIGETDTALYGRVTFGMMEGYWPTAADQPNATQHDIEHADWYKRAHKIVLSRTMSPGQRADVDVIAGDLAARIQKIKKDNERDILVFGSPGATHSLLEQNLIDAYWLYQNPILLGEGIPVFRDIRHKQQLRLVSSHVFSSGVNALHYENK